jgi:hypothetical protein
MRDLVIDPSFDPRDPLLIVQAENALDEFAYGGYDRIIIDPTGIGAALINLIRRPGVLVVEKRT